MKKSLLFLVCCFTLFVGRAQYVAIPDTMFGNWLNGHGYSQCLLGSTNAGWQMDTTCSAILDSTSVNLFIAHVKNIEGIQYFKNLNYLQCNGNSISNLPPLPPRLRTLACGINVLTSLPPLPDSLENLYCTTNLLTYLPPLPKTLKLLDCKFNLLNALPDLPDSLFKITCNDNNLSALPTLPDSLYYLNCENNPITCLPFYKRIVTIYYMSTFIACNPNYGNVTNSFPPLNSLPTCDSINPNNCTFYNSVNTIVSNDFLFTLSPNPATNQLSISIDESLIGAQLNIYNVTGSLVQSTQLQMPNSKFEIQNLPNGVYVAVVTTPKSPKGDFNTVMRRWVKM